MTWSTEDPRPAPPVLGDPASLSALASTLQRTAAEIDGLLAAVAAAAPEHRRHAAALRRIRSHGSHVTGSLHRTGRRLGEHSVELAEALGLAQRVLARAEDLGLGVDGPTVIRHRGVRGVADAGGERDRGAALVRLQAVLDSVLRDLDRSRLSLREDLARERARCTSR